jgi:hypothetical protein
MNVSEWTTRQALFCLIGSTLCTLILSLGGYALWKERRLKQLNDPKFRISAIIQTGPEKEALKTSYLAEVLGLSADQPISLYVFDLEKGEEKLLSSPLIADGKIQRLPPNALYVDYEVRRPVAWLADYKNTAIDRDGYIFPVAPFFSPKQLPEIYLGLPPFGTAEDKQGRKGGQWQSPLKGRYLQLAFEALQFFEGSSWKEGLKIKRIDVSNAWAPSLGSRELVVFTEEEIALKENGRELVCVFPKILRLSPKDYPQQLANFSALRRNMLEDYKRQIAGSQQEGRFSPRIVDLRIPQLAFVEEK